MPNAISRHFTQDANLLGTNVALGAMTATVILLLNVHGEDRLILSGLLPFTVLPGVVVLLLRLIRPFRGKAAVAPHRCPVCGEPGATSPVRYLRHTGAVVVMIMKETSVFACRRCSRSLFFFATLHSLALGWWGIFSFFINPGCIVNNVLFLLRSQIASGGGRRHARQVLGEHADYARNLLATKPRAVVVEVLARTTGLPSDVVDRELDGLQG